MEKEHWTIKEIAKQLESCEYECQRGKLELNVAFIALKKIAESGYQTQRYIGEKLITEAGEYVEVISLSGSYDHRAAGQVFPKVCKCIYQSPDLIKFKKLYTKKEYRQKMIDEALQTLSQYDYQDGSISKNAKEEE